MDDAMKELGRRAIAAGWRWMPGVRAYDALPFPMYARQVAPTDYGYGAEIEGHPDLVGSFGDPDEDWVPDFSDPATLGCLLAQVRERWGDLCIYVHCDDDDDHDGAGVFWTVDSPRWTRVRTYAECPFHPTEAAALVAALEAAPKVAP